MKDFFNSLDKALLDQKWVFDDRWSRIGNPFSWIDGQRMDDRTFLKQEYAILQCLAMYYEKYDSPEKLKSSIKHEECLKQYINTLKNIVKYFFQPLDIDQRILNNINCTALARTQDFAFIDNFLIDLPSNPVHLDIGPGLGTHAIYSQKMLNSTYIAVEANDYMYGVQRLIYRYLSSESNPYYDVIVAEALGVDSKLIQKNINSKTENSIIHLPSWHFSLLQENTVDLITATFVLNEVSPAGILWLISNSNKVLNNNGYFYIRDSNKLKPNRHAVNYDSILKDLGYVLVEKLDIVNRVDMFGIPRAYQKKKHTSYTFEELFDKYIGFFAVTNHGGEFMQNLAKNEVKT